MSSSANFSNQKGSKMKRIIALIVSIIAILAVIQNVNSAFANTNSCPNGQTSCLIYSAPTMDTSSSTSSVSTTVLSAATASNFSGSKLLIADVNLTPGTNTASCKTVPHGYNSGKLRNGKVYYFYDPKPARICRNGHSPTGWVKVGGGTSGRNCHNPYAPPATRVPGPITKSYILVKDFNTLASTVKATLDVSNTVMSTAMCYTQNSSGWASASAYAYGKGRAAASATSTARAILTTTATNTATNTAVKLVNDQSAQTNESALVAASLDLLASTSVSCGGYTSQQLVCSKGSTTDTNGYTCVKDGSTTPQPTSNPSPGGTNTPPGPNPSPSPGSPSSPCYSTTDGTPVAANPNGTCPAGSYGGVQPSP
jgi:hypothetical protein